MRIIEPSYAKASAGYARNIEVNTEMQKGPWNNLQGLFYADIKTIGKNKNHESALGLPKRRF